VEADATQPLVEGWVCVKIVVIFKWARDPQDAAVRSDGSVDWRDARMVPGDDDPAAIAVARDLVASVGGDTVGITIGDGDATWALARGIEQVITVPDAPRLLDDAATAELLAAAIRWVGDVDLVVIGDCEAYPGVPAALAGVLGWPAFLGASGAAVADGRLVATRRSEDHEDTIGLGLPAVLAVAATSAEKHPPGMKEILAARKRPIRVVSVAELGIDPLDRLQSRGTRVPETGTARIFTGSPASTARELVAALRADHLL